MTALPVAPIAAAPVVAPRACVFRCGGRAYAVPVTQVREVAMLPRVTPVPRMPAQIRGVASLRGLLLPVVDPAPHLGHAPLPLMAVTPVVVLKDGAQDVGLAVEAIAGLLPMETPCAVPAGLPPAVAAVAVGAFLSEGRPVVLLEGEALLAALRPVPVDAPVLP
ncbi:MAG: chemotaxis protein CheW [Gemmatimonadetes bacterium]|jgi:chemotaxis signal transduction protein|nr:chemotaxis protein CheW [Gemmatimonadota bacterium]MBP9200201.1 chemotaxis protein CheW [Gemmatimonadales bacterium]MBK7348238.1 chemotaxis protein CheW [Gemmatimonadota bacterium]MBK7785312.1 chemotaxis protein CheW [Gemmatimonadota bacterium]MBK7923811.1 chemotaxis protein CheW [Gemmatimonadota bacterium]